MVKTAKGEISGRALVMATNAYSGDMLRRSLASLLELARGSDGGEVGDPEVRSRAAGLSMMIDAASCLGYRLMTRMLRGQPPGAETSAIKLASTETWQAICDLALEVSGPKSQVWRDPRFDEADRRGPLIAVASRSCSSKVSRSLRRPAP